MLERPTSEESGHAQYLSSRLRDRQVFQILAREGMEVSLEVVPKLTRLLSGLSSCLVVGTQEAV